MDFKKTGDWAKVKYLVANIGREMQNARTICLMRWGLKAEGLAKTHISTQDLGWAPLKPATIANKIRQGYSENILVETSTYFQSITSWADTNTVYAGVRREVRYKDGEVIADIAKIHEYGSHSGDIPARPLWEPTFEETMQWQMKGVNTPANIFKQQIKKYFA